MQHSEKAMRQGGATMWKLFQVRDRDTEPKGHLLCITEDTDAARLRQECKYELPDGSLLSPSPSSPPRSEFLSSLSQTFTSTHLKDSIIARLGKITAEDIFSSYTRAIEPWFPVVSKFSLRTWSLASWEEVSLDAALLCLSIKLLTMIPPTSSETDTDTSDFKSLYLYTKCALSLSRSADHNKTLACCGYTSQQTVLSLRSYVLPLPTLNLGAKSTIPKLVAGLEKMPVIVQEA